LTKRGKYENKAFFDGGVRTKKATVILVVGKKRGTNKIKVTHLSRKQNFSAQRKCEEVENEALHDGGG